MSMQMLYTRVNHKIHSGSKEQTTFVHAAIGHGFDPRHLHKNFKQSTFDKM